MQENVQKKVYLLCFGCHCLRHEMGRISVFIKDNGFIQVDDPVDADFLVIGGEGPVTEAENDAFARIIDIRKIAKQNSIKVVYGGIATTAELKLKKYDDLILVKYGEEEKFDEIFGAAKKFSDVIFNTEGNKTDDYRMNFIAEFHPLSEERIRQKKLCDYLDSMYKTDKFAEAFNCCTEHEYLFFLYKDIFEIKIGTGCVGNCSYCIIKKAIGNLQSVPAKKIISQIYDGLKKGYARFIFVGYECGYWGIDIKDDLCNLLDRIADIKKETKKPIQLVVPYIHPDKLIASYERLLPHFLSGLIIITSVPVQTGSQKIMRMMNRRTDIEKLKVVLQDMYNKKVPTYIQTHIMVGFPGETIGDLYETIEFARDVHFDFVEIAAFSARPGTPAAKFKHQLSKKEIHERALILVKYLNVFRSHQLLHRITNILDTIK